MLTLLKLILGISSDSRRSCEFGPMALLIAKQELNEHVPIVRDSLIVGCNACEWTSVISSYAGSTWDQYLRHLPTFRVDGAFIPSDSDVEMFAKMEVAFEGPVKKFEESE